MPNKLKSLLLVAESCSNIIVPVKKNLIQVNSINQIFPAIHDHKPDGIILDYDFLGNDMEKILRRLMSNPFYRGIKISCYKSKPHTKVDDLLKALGVQQFIYEQDRPAITAQPKSLTGILKSVYHSKLALRFMH